MYVIDENGWLVHHTNEAKIDFLKGVNTGGPFTQPPKYIVMHYTASGGTAMADAQYFASLPKGGPSAHLIIDRDGSIVQQVSFHDIAYHAGRSFWSGLVGLNKYSIGIELDNWGLLEEGADGKYRTWTKKVISVEDVFIAPHKNNYQRVLPWENYKEPQILSAFEVVSAICKAYPSIKDIIGHDDCAPARKTDPGPAFPMRKFKTIVDNAELMEVDTTENLLLAKLASRNSVE